MGMRTKSKRRTRYDRSEKPLGAITIRYSAGNCGRKAQRWIKVSMSGPPQKRWMPYSRWIWESLHGEVPHGKRVIHKDGDLLNDDPDNLVLGTPGDVVYLAHANDPDMSQKNYQKLRKATADHNRERGRVRRALGWLPTRWYAYFPVVNQVWNAPAKKLNHLLDRCGISCDWRRQFSFALGWGNRSRGEALVITALESSAEALTVSEIAESINRLIEPWGWRPRTTSGIYQSLSPLIDSGVCVRENARHRLTGIEDLERTRKSPVIPLRGEALQSHEAFLSVEKVWELRGVCRLCGCTENNACWDDQKGPCAWVSTDLCSHCHSDFDAGPNSCLSGNLVYLRKQGAKSEKAP